MQYTTAKKSLSERKWIILGIIVLVSLGVGIVVSIEDGMLDLRGLLGNLSTELVGGVITFVLIDQFILKNEDEAVYRDSLISKLENPDNGIVKQTVQELRTRGWLQDGSLYGWFIQKANFEGIKMKVADMNGVGLYRCNLKNTEFRVDQFMVMNDLRRSTMPDGTFYDGRYCLKGDIAWANKNYGINFMSATVAEMAGYYEVSEEVFIEGQRWAYDNLPLYNREIPPYLVKLMDELNKMPRT